MAIREINPLYSSVWDTTVFPGEVRYSLVVRYLLGYRIHSDTGPFEGQIHSQCLFQVSRGY